MYSLNVFVFVIVFVLVFLFVIFLVKSCLLITLIKCRKVHKSLALLLGGILKMYLSLSLSLYLYLSLSLPLSILFGHVMSSHHSEKCLKGHKSLGLLLGCVLKMSLSLFLSLSLPLSLYLSL